MTTLPVSQNKRRVLYRNLMVAAIAALAICALVNRVSDVPMHLPAMFVAIGIGVLSFLQFNALDEMVKQAHYIAWYWGGLIALTAVGVMAGAIGVAPQAFAGIESLMLAWFDKADAQTSFLLGLITAPILLMLGFAGWWTVYWLRHR